MKKRIYKSLALVAIVLFSMTLFAQTESKVAVLTVSGSGATQDAAKQNALRNAIEQAFGTFISSNTQILNDELVKDEIVSVSSGNIQEYTIISEVQTPDGYWSNTVNATVSIDKLTSFCESKGVQADLKGALFALNVKQQILNEENEIKAIKNMCKVLKEISEYSFDYEIVTSEPISIGGRNENWKVPITITAKTNANFKLMSDYLAATLKGLSLTPNEVLNYSKLGKKYKTLAFCPLGYQPQTYGKKRKKKSKIEINSNYSPSLLYLRKDESVVELINLIIYFRKTLFNFAIINDLKTVQGQDFLDNGYYPTLHVRKFFPIMDSRDGLISIFSESFYSDRPKTYKPHVPHQSNQIKSTYCDLSKLGSYQYKAFPFLAEIDPSMVLSRYRYGLIDLVISFWQFEEGFTAEIISYNDPLTLEQLSKISGYKIIHRVGGSEVDQEGNLFKNTFIGNQRWMSQDLNVTHFSNGDPIQGILYREPEKWSESKNAAYIIEISRSDYKLYNWYTIVDNRNVCPSGWHVPSEAEWGILVDFLGGKEIAGGKMKAIKDERNNYSLWNNPNKNDINEFFFSSKPNDYRDGSIVHYKDGKNAIYWVKLDLNSSNSGKSAIISNDDSKLTIGSANAHSGSAIRCIKD